VTEKRRLLDNYERTTKFCKGCGAALNVNRYAEEFDSVTGEPIKWTLHYRCPNYSFIRMLWNDFKSEILGGQPLRSHDEFYIEDK